MLINLSKSILRLNSIRATLLSISMVTNSACELIQKKKKSESSPPPPTLESVLAPNSGNISQLDITILFPQTPVHADSSPGILNIKNLPEGAQLECDISGTPIINCSNGSSIQVPKVSGIFRLNVFAISENKILAQGSFEFTVINENKAGVVNVPNESDPLKLNLISIAAHGFTWDGKIANITIPLHEATGDVTLEFSVKDDSLCSSDMTVFCKFGSQNSEWFLCDTRKSLKLPKYLLGFGPALVEIEAKCKDKIGPRLAIPLYFVRHSYEFMSLEKISDPTGKTLVLLQNESDCHVDDRRFECREGSQTEFSRCKSANLIPKSDTPKEVRLRCGDKVGPVTKI